MRVTSQTVPGAAQSRPWAEFVGEYQAFFRVVEELMYLSTDVPIEESQELGKTGLLPAFPSYSRAYRYFDTQEDQKHHVPRYSDTSRP
jgi:hypothetical protein